MPYVLIPSLLLVIAYSLVTNVSNISPLPLRLASVVIPLLFGFAAYRVHKVSANGAFVLAFCTVFDAGTVVLAEIGNRFVIGRQPGEQPHHFDVAASFTLEPAARMNTVGIAVNVEP